MDVVVSMKPGLLKTINHIPLLLMITVTGLSFIGVTAQGSIKLFYMAVVILAPGYYIVKIVGCYYPLHIDEFITSCIIASGLSLLFSYILLTTVASQVAPPLLWLVLTSVALISYIGYYLTECNEQPDSSNEVYHLVGLLTCYLPCIIITAKAIPQQYWRGSDAWETHSIVSYLVENSMNPHELISYWKSFVFLYNFGYYYILAAFSLVTGFSMDAILRYGGIFQAAFLAFLTYITVKKMMGTIQGVLASWLIFFNPWLVLRFVTPIRENFSIFLLVFIVYYIQLVKTSKMYSRILNISIYTVVLLAAIMIHALTPIFIMGVYFVEALNQYVGGSHEKAFDYLTSTILAILFLGSFYPFIFDPFTSFIINDPVATILLISTIPSSVLLIAFLKKSDAYKILDQHRVRAIIIALIALILFFTLLYPPNLGPNFNYGYIKLDYFSPPFLLLSLVGAFTFVKKRVPVSIMALSLMLFASLAASYLGVEVPLSRLAVYIIWVMSYVVAHFFSTVHIPITWGNVSNLTMKDLLNKGLEWSKVNRVLLIILLFFSAVTVNDIRNQRRFFPTYTSFEVEAARSFVSNLDEGDIIYTQGEAEILLYYLGAPRNNIVHDPVKEQTLKAIFKDNSPYNVSDLVHENYPNATRLHIALQDYESFSISDEPISKIFQYYTSNRQYGSTFVYSLSIPFTVETIEPQIVKFIEKFGDEPVIVEGDPGAWDHSITSFSNCIVEQGQRYPFKMYYSGNDLQGDYNLGLAYSSDGFNWMKRSEPIHTREYKYLYLLHNEGLYYLFCQRVTDFSIVRLESSDGLNWGNEFTIFMSAPEEMVRVQEAPVVWIENQTWHMLFWELKLGSNQFYNKMVYATSLNGYEWMIPHELDRWELFDYRHYRYEYDKILPLDILKTREGYLLHAKFLAEDKTHEKIWRVGSIYVPGTIISSSAKINTLFFKDLQGSSNNVDSVHMISKPISGRTMYFYADFDENDYQGLTNGVCLGFISDYFDVSDDLLTWP